MSTTPHLPMRVIERAVYTGPHRYSRTPMVRIRLDLGGLRDRPTTKLHGFTDRLLDAVPALLLHGCSVGRSGGFVARMRGGTWVGHVIEHVALALQNLAGHTVTRGKTRAVPGHPGWFDVMFAYRDPAVALAAGRLAIELVDGMLPPGLAGTEGLGKLGPQLQRSTDDGTVHGMSALRALVESRALGPTTASLMEAARRRAIPVEHDELRRVLRLGTGSRQSRLQAGVTHRTSLVAAELAGDKARTKAVLERIGLPVPRGTVVTTADAAVAAARELGGPVVAKPLDGNHGRGVTLHLLNDDEVREGFEKSARIGRRVLIERQLVGRDYRLLIVGGRMVAAAERMPAGAVGDGSSTVEQLIEALNADPRRGAGHAKVLSRILVDDDLLRVLGRQGLTLDAVPESGRAVGLRDAANLSAGGEAIDRTDEVHPTIREAAEQAAGVIGLDIAGIDLIAPDIAAPLDVERSGIVEVNAGPGFRMHLAPSVGEPRDVAAPVIELLHPRGTRSTIPVLAVTGSNGKSTVVRMLGRIFERNGARVGMTTTVGVEIGGRLVKEADASGPRSARQVLADPNVDVAVLETARGGILREGLGYGIADVGVVLNVTGDHLGVGGVRTLGELAKIKSVVIRNVRRRGTSVLNADDPLTLRMTRVATGRIALFTMRGLRDAAPEVSAHAAGGDLVGTIEDGVLTVHQGGRAVPLVAAAELPSTIGGIAEFNVQNALAAAVAATAQGVAPEAVVAGLRDFESTYEDNPGRLNITRAPGFTTIVDYGHNPPALRALGRMLERMRSDHDRLIGVVSTPGDRRDEDIREVGAVAAGIFDELVFRERPDGRGRAPGGVLALLMEGATAAGMPPERISQVIDEPSAMQTALEAAGPRDLVVLLPTDVAAVWRQATTFTSRWRVEAGS